MPLFHILHALSVVAVWGCNFVFIKFAVAAMPPLQLCALRFLIASIPAIFFIKRPLAPLSMLITYGLIMFGLQFSLLFMGIYAGVTPGMASLLMQTQIFFSILIAVVFLGEKPSLWQVIGAIVAFSGIAVVMLNLNNGITLAGFLLVIASAASWGFGNLVLKRMGHVNMIALVVWASLVACPPLFIVSFIFEGTQTVIDSYLHFSWLAVMSLLYIVFASTWYAYTVWNWLLSKYPVTSVVPFTLLVPVFGMVSAVIVLDEPMQTWKLTAAALIVGGLCINLLGQRYFSSRKQI